MHQLAIALKNKGYIVSGSDDEIKDPARTNLLNNGLLPQNEGWQPELITKDLDAVILGMHARADNPELLQAQSLGIKVYSFPQFIYELSKDKKRIVVAGSHGKTSTTSMIMHVLKEYNYDFDYLVGAKVEGFEHSVKITDAPYIVIEGDEYLSSAIERAPKIHFYYPHIAVITGIAWDHINVFPTFENYCEQFSIFLNKMEENASIIYNAQDCDVVKVVESAGKHLKSLPYLTPDFDVINNELFVDTNDGPVKLQIFGSHNLQNMEAARKVCQAIGIENQQFYKAMQTFKGAARRLEKIYDSEELIVFRDFAHAPSKLKATVKAARERYEHYKIIGIFELHTFSSLNANFLHEYQNSLDGCDAACVYFSEHALQLKKLPILDKQDIKMGFDNKDLTVISEKTELAAFIKQQTQFDKIPVCLLLMSSGTLDDLDLTFPK